MFIGILGHDLRTKLASSNMAAAPCFKITAGSTREICDELATPPE